MYTQQVIFIIAEEIDLTGCMSRNELGFWQKKQYFYNQFWNNRSTVKVKQIKYIIIYFSL